MLRDSQLLDRRRFAERLPTGTVRWDAIPDRYVRRALPRLVDRLQSRAERHGGADEVQFWFSELSHRSYQAAWKRLVERGAKKGVAWGPWPSPPKDQLPFALWTLEARSAYSIRFMPEQGPQLAPIPGKGPLNPNPGSTVGALSTEDMLARMLLMLLGKVRHPAWTRSGALFAPPIIERRFDNQRGPRRFALEDYGIDWALPAAGGVLNDGHEDANSPTATGEDQNQPDTSM